MKYLDTIHKRKSATVTTIIMILLLIVIFVFGLKYLDPPIESGIAVNFGTSNVGSGAIQPTTPIKTQVKPEITQEPEKVEKVEESSPQETSDTEKVLTQESEESIKIKQKEKDDQLQKEADAAEKLRIEAELKVQEDLREEAERLKKEQDEKKKKLDAIIGGVENSDGVETDGEGDDNVSGDKGKVTGDPIAKGYYGNGGSGGNGDYQLGNRKPLNRPKPAFKCEEKGIEGTARGSIIAKGIVVVIIKVDRNGKVIFAQPGAKGSTTTNECLKLEAKDAALKTKWSPDPEGSEIQMGSITFNFDQEAKKEED